ncbi:hypothetical protein ACW9HC_09815 [Nocardia gipuzkoensis]
MSETVPIVHALLKHLADAGFTGSPRVVGSGFDDAGRETLGWIEGRIAYPDGWSDEGIWATGRLLHELHSATVDFVPPPGTRWPAYWLRREGPDSVIGHCDAGPWNTVVRNGLPVALIHWEVAGPVDRLDEVAACAWWHAQLRADRPDAPPLPAVEVRAAQLGLFLDGYRLPAGQRAQVVERMIEFAIRECAAEAEEARITPCSTDPEPLWGLAWRARAAAWMIEHRAILERAAVHRP